MSNKEKFENNKTKKIINNNIKNNESINSFFGSNKNERKLYNYFNKKKIYIEIYSYGINCSNGLYEKLKKYNIIRIKKLSLNIDFIIFDNGHLKTKKYAYLNGIKIVSPSWAYDKFNNIFKDEKEYFIPTNYTDILLANNKEIKKDIKIDISIKREKRISPNTKKEKAKNLNKNNNNLTLDIYNIRNASNKIEDKEGIKIKIISFNLIDTEIASLKNLYIFEYRGELGKIEDDNNLKIYNETDYIILDFEKTKNKWELFKFILDKKTVIDIGTFLLEFINEEVPYMTKNIMQNINEKIKKISINNDILLLKKNLINIKIIQKNYKSEKKNLTIDNSPKFIISKSLKNEEINVLQKLLKNYLKATILENTNNKRSNSYNNKNINNIKSLNKSNSDKKINIIKEKELPIKNKIYLITKEIPMNKYFNIDININFIISPSYVYDSFLKSKLLDLNDINVYKQYEIK